MILDRLNNKYFTKDLDKKKKKYNPRNMPPKSKEIKTGPLDPTVIEWTDRNGWAGQTVTPRHINKELIIGTIVGLGLAVVAYIGLAPLLTR